MDSFVDYPEIQPGRVRILIRFFEELGKTGKILKFKKFYLKFKEMDGKNIPLEEFDDFFDDIPDLANEKNELALKLFFEKDAPSMYLILYIF